MKYMQFLIMFSPERSLVQKRYFCIIKLNMYIDIAKQILQSSKELWDKDSIDKKKPIICSTLLFGKV